MALNYSLRHSFPPHDSDNNLVSPFGIMNDYLLETFPRKWEGESSRRCRGANLEEDKEINYGCFTQESAEDILDLLPSDPFGMGIQSTVTAITGWLEDLEFNCDRYMSNNGNTGQNGCKYDSFSFFWDHALSFPPLPHTYHFNEMSNSAFPCSFSNLIVDKMPFLYHEYFPGTFALDEKLNVPNLVDMCNKEKCVEAGLQTCGMFDVLGSEGESDRISAHLSPARQVKQTVYTEGAPHDALAFSLSYMGVQDLLSVERVCKSLLSSVRYDPLLWMTIHIGQPLNERITDDILLNLASRAGGNLQCLSLVECPKVTDDGLRRILETNPQLSKLSVPGCTRISIDCVVDSIEAFNSRKNVGGIKSLRIGGLYGVDHEHFEKLKLLLGDDDTKKSGIPGRQYFFHRGNFYLPYEDDRAIDIEMCPRCEKYRLVYDCPSEGCNSKPSQACRACTLCIARCAQCGRCVNDTEFEETFCLELLCSDCFKEMVSYQDKMDKEVGDPSGSLHDPSYRFTHLG